MDLGKLYLVPVPIGNLKDITIRALDVLSQVDYILAEDTRVSKILLSSYEIETPLISYHQHNEKSRVEDIVQYLNKGKNLALITDAGMPCISDPGAIIVDELLALDYKVIALPGPNAALTALAASGLNTDSFTFIGFLSTKGKDRKNQLEKINKLEDTILLYEAPHRVLKTLADLIEIGLSERRISIGRELTKKFETYLYGTIQSSFNHYQGEKPRGEFVFVLEGKQDYQDRTLDKAKQIKSDLKKLDSDLKELLDGGMHTKSAVNFLAKSYPVKKNKIYQLALELTERNKK